MFGVDHGLIAHDWLVKQVSNSVAFRGGVSVFVALASISFLTELLIQGMQHFHRNSEARSPLARDALPWSLCAVSTEILPGFLKSSNMLSSCNKGKLLASLACQTIFFTALCKFQVGAEALQRNLHDLLCFLENAQSSAFQGLVQVQPN